MSVLVLDLGAFAYIENALRKAAYHRVCDEHYSYVISSLHFPQGNVEAETERLVKSWLQLNEKSYDFRYKDNDTGGSMVPFYQYKLFKTYPLQTFQYLECLIYNIEVTKRIEENEVVYYWDEPNKYGARKLDQQETKDYELLLRWRDDLATTIIHRLPQWSKLDYEKGEPFIPDGRGIFEGA